MAAALTRLGLKTFHSGFPNFANRRPWCQYLFGNGRLEDALPTLAGYDAAMDEPFQLVYDEVMHAFPRAKFILTMADPQTWYDSYDALIQQQRRQLADPFLQWVYNFTLRITGWPSVLDPDPNSWFSYCTEARYWGCDFGNSNASVDSRQKCMESYQQHNERVMQAIPADRLLVYNFSDGWAPIAHFLGKPIPDVPFPYVDEKPDVPKGNPQRSSTQ
ncbi:unnamed protein product [Symbiodinium pilosum]|uniref:Uncharacterized protein n=1 Tax=Symbiodinium pilosum TaxID=2952 RepID=A0A812LWW1_SYMPI|nr:unnamed protein product [Symbiodinium pilosum]